MLSRLEERAFIMDSISLSIIAISCISLRNLIYTINGQDSYITRDEQESKSHTH